MRVSRGGVDGDETEPGFVDESGGLEGMTGREAPEIRRPNYTSTRDRGAVVCPVTLSPVSG